MFGQSVRRFHYRDSLVIPFVNTRLITEVGGLFVLLPVWWVVGVEQFIWPLGFFWVGAKMVVAQKGRLKVSPTLRWLFVFIILHLISGVFIVETFRWITFLRNFSTCLSAFLLLLIVVNRVRTWHDIEFLLRALVYMMAVASIVGLLGVLSAWQPDFKSVVGRFLPAWILNTDYGGTIGYRSTGHYGWFVVLGRYFRVNSFFLFPTLYASALAVSSPIAWFLHAHTRGKGEKLLLKGVILLFLINLAFATARVATLSFLLGGFYFLTFVSGKQRLSRWLLVFLVLAMGLILLADIFQDGTSIIAETAAEYFERLTEARTSGEARMAVYRHTLAGVVQRPLFGWGTERDVPEFHLPAGSHNNYLAILYRHGIAGFLAFLGVLWSLWKETRPPVQKPGAELGNPLFAKLLQYGRWVIVAALLDGLATVPITDATTMVAVWLIFSLLIASNRLYREAGKIQING